MGEKNLPLYVYPIYCMSYVGEYIWYNAQQVVHCMIVKKTPHENIITYRSWASEVLQFVLLGKQEGVHKAELGVFKNPDKFCLPLSQTHTDTLTS